MKYGDNDPWYEYHVDFIPDGIRTNLNGGIGDYVSQRRLCRRVRPCAPITDAKLIPVLCDLLIVSSPQLHELLRRDLDELTYNKPVEKEFFRHGVSLGTFEGVVTKRSVASRGLFIGLSVSCISQYIPIHIYSWYCRYDDSNHFQVVYSDGDREHLDCDELLAVLQVSRAHKEWIATAYRDLSYSCAERKQKGLSQRIPSSSHFNQEASHLVRDYVDGRTVESCVAPCITFASFDMTYRLAIAKME